MTPDEVLDVARAGAASGCTEALFTLGDKAERRYRVARDELMEEAVRAAGRVPRQRTTLYGTASAERTAASFGAPPLADPVNPPVDTSRLRRPKVLVRPGLVVA